MEVFTERKIRLEKDEIICLRRAANILEELEEETSGENDWECKEIAEALQAIAHTGEWTIEEK